MKIFFEATPTFNNKRVPAAGIAHYIFHIYQGMKQYDKANDYIVFGLYFLTRSTEFKELYPKDTRFKLIRYVPAKIFNLANRRAILPPIELMTAAKADVYLFTHFRRFPTLSGAKTATIIYDTGYHYYPETINKKNLKYLERRVPQTVKKSDLIITISEAAKQDIVKIYGANPEKVVVATCGIDTNKFKPGKLSESVRKKYGLPAKYLLFVGSIEPRKNIERLVQAYNSLPAKLQKEYALVLAGGKGWNDEGIHNAIKSVKEPGRVVVTGYVDEDDIEQLYRGATLYTFPSLYEGFGMSILEAMACDVPVLTANNSSLPEVGGDAALYANEKDVKDIASKIEFALTHQKEMQALVQKGREQIKKFSWDKSAQVIVDSLNKLSKR
ncbi:glycosyltransferase family 4 protein [Candidatus Saccharibacteria bacterium]|nr:glycosyltransferase family 4 protein [Candidatus Saccharibacteria bacterium]